MSPPPRPFKVVEAARGVLNRYIPDIYIYTDVYKGKESGLSPGYALTLVAEVRLKFRKFNFFH